MKVIIVGGVAGGASCAARLRRLDENAEIVMVERGQYVSYANSGLVSTSCRVIGKFTSYVAPVNGLTTQREFCCIMGSRHALSPVGYSPVRTRTFSTIERREP